MQLPVVGGAGQCVQLDGRALDGRYGEPDAEVMPGAVDLAGDGEHACPIGTEPVGRPFPGERGGQPRYLVR
ncbi:MAG: hypothetical protein ACRDNS_30395 [Trebonia sp.]